MDVDFGTTAADYARHRVGLPDALFDRLLSLGWVAADARVLDLGSGTGHVARHLARRGCTVTGIEPSPTLIEHARVLDREAGLEIAYVEGRAEKVALPAASFDLVIAGETWHWLERSTALAEARRLLVPGGMLIIAQFDWLALPGNAVEATEELIRVDDPAWTLGGDRGIYPQWLADAATAGFEDVESFSFDVTVPYTVVAWRGRIRATGRVVGGKSPSQLEAFDDALVALVAAHHLPDPMPVPHRVWAMMAKKG